MKILISPNGFKNSLTCFEACEAILEGFKKTYKDGLYLTYPIADGGEGTCEILTKYSNGKYYSKEITFCDLTKRVAKYGFDKLNKIAFIESSEAVGIIHIKKEKLNPLKMTSFGLGELVLSAIDKGAKTIVIGIGGTCTNDGGMGLLSSLGIKFYHDETLLDGNGENLIKINKISLDGLNPKVRDVSFVIASDVDNTLCGDKGATYCYGKQKGANEQMLELLEKGMINFASQSKKILNKDLISIVGGGSGGGLGAGICSYLNAKIVSGFDYIESYINIEEKIKNVDVVITGEGKIDEQTLHGKGPYKIASLAKKYNKYVIAFCGICKVKTSLFDKVYPLCEKETTDFSNSYNKLVDISYIASKDLKENNNEIDS